MDSILADLADLEGIDILEILTDTFGFDIKVRHDRMQTRTHITLQHKLYGSLMVSGVDFRSALQKLESVCKDALEKWESMQ